MLKLGTLNFAAGITRTVRCYYSSVRVSVRAHRGGVQRDADGAHAFRTHPIVAETAYPQRLRLVAHEARQDLAGERTEYLELPRRQDRQRARQRATSPAQRGTRRRGAAGGELDGYGASIARVGARNQLSLLQPVDQAHAAGVRQLERNAQVVDALAPVLREVDERGGAGRSMTGHCDVVLDCVGHGASQGADDVGDGLLLHAANYMPPAHTAPTPLASSEGAV